MIPANKVAYMHPVLILDVVVYLFKKILAVMKNARIK